MGREVRKVHPSWAHPKNAKGHHIPLHDLCYSEQKEDWDRGLSQWKTGDYCDDQESTDLWSYVDYVGGSPRIEDYMPEWADEEATHFQMYENVTEGTPISPVMESPEALARWLADNGVSAGFGRTASYEQWLSVCTGGYAPSMVVTSGPDGAIIRTGVEAMHDREET